MSAGHGGEERGRDLAAAVLAAFVVDRGGVRLDLRSCDGEPERERSTPTWLAATSGSGGASSSHGEPLAGSYRKMTETIEWSVRRRS